MMAWGSGAGRPKEKFCVESRSGTRSTGLTHSLRRQLGVSLGDRGCYQREAQGRGGQGRKATVSFLEKVALG